MTVQYPRWNDYLFCATAIAAIAALVLALTGYREGVLWAILVMLVCSMCRAEKQRDYLEKLLEEREKP
jgi:hypothetical protein